MNTFLSMNANQKAVYQTSGSIWRTTANYDFEYA